MLINGKSARSFVALVTNGGLNHLKTAKIGILLFNFIDNSLEQKLLYHTQ